MPGALVAGPGCFDVAVCAFDTDVVCLSVTSLCMAQLALAACRYERLKAALRSPALARALEADFPFQPMLAFLINFVAKALTALPSILLVRDAHVRCDQHSTTTTIFWVGRH